MSSPLDGLLFAWKKNLDYGPKLVADLSEYQMMRQPAPPDAPPANHPAWIFSHLNAYLPVIEAIIEGNTFDDPKLHRFGMLSHPEQDPLCYRSKKELVETFVAGHQRIQSLLENANDSVLERPVLLPRWKEIMPTAAIALPYLMLNHENLHLGQLSAWRRVQGLPSV